jgi:hypothetical protein
MEELLNKLVDYVAYSHLWHLLAKTNSDEDLKYLMVRVVEIEEEILSHYGLPLTFNHSDILQELGIKDDFKLSDINSCIEHLEQIAKKHFDSPILTDMELLRSAQESRLDIDNVLPELTLKLYAEPYYFFCYYFLFLPKKITPELFLEELKSVVNHKCSDKLTRLVEQNLSDYSTQWDYHEVKIIGLHFIDIFSLLSGKSRIL